MAATREVKCVACLWKAVRYFGNGILVQPCPDCGRRVKFAEVWPGEVPHSASVELIPVNPRTGKGWTDAEEDVIAQTMLAEGCDRGEAIRYARRHKQIGTGSPAFLSSAGTRADWPLEPTRDNFPSQQTKVPTLPTIKRASLSTPETPFAPPYSPDPVASRPALPTDGQPGINARNKVINARDTFSEQNPFSGLTHPEPQAVIEIHVEMPRKAGRGRPRKWQSNTERMATVREQQKPLALPPLPDGVYRAREVVTAKSSPRSTARRDYHADLRDNRCFFCEREFGIYIQKNDARPEPLRVEDEHFIPRRLPGSRKDENRHAVCHICNKLKNDLVFNSEEQCRAWLAAAWNMNGYHETAVHAIRYLGEGSSVLFEERLASVPELAADAA
jgi:hypothetical protein